MADETNDKDTQSGTKGSGSSEKSDLVKSTQADSLSPQQKHKNYLDLLEKLHNEP